MSDAPDRIWADTLKDVYGVPEWDTGAWGSSREGDDDACYLLSTPAREHADELVEALEVLRHEYRTALRISGVDEMTSKTMAAANEVLAKIKEASNE